MTPQQEAREAWFPPEQLPPVREGAEGQFIVAVKRAHSGKVYSFAAQYLNRRVLDFDCDMQRRPCTGWFSSETDSDMGLAYTELLSPGDEMLGWREVPQWAGLHTSAVADEAGVEVATLAEVVARRILALRAYVWRPTFKSVLEEQIRAAILATERRLAAQHAAEMARAERKVADALGRAMLEHHGGELDGDVIWRAYYGRNWIDFPLRRLAKAVLAALSPIAPHGAQEPEA